MKKIGLVDALMMLGAFANLAVAMLLFVYIAFGSR